MSSVDDVSTPGRQGRGVRLAVVLAMLAVCLTLAVALVARGAPHADPAPNGGTSTVETPAAVPLPGCLCSGAPEEP